MNNITTRPSLNTLISEMGRVGKRLEIIGACEASAGNLSIYAGWNVGPVDEIFPLEQDYPLAYPVLALAGGTIIVTGSGRRLPDIADDPLGSLGLVQVASDGCSAVMRTSHKRLFDRYTCEFNSHLAVHNDQIQSTKSMFHALVHAQPIYLTYLSNISRYQDPMELNRRLYSWQSECLVQIPDGIGYIPYYTPGSTDLEKHNIELLKKHVIVLWAKHGVMSRSSDSIMHACDYIEYLETAARFEFMNLQAGEPTQGLSPEEIRDICSTYNLKQCIF